MIMQNTTKRNLHAFIMFMLFATISTAQTKETEFSINHGPYLQEITQEGVTIVFTTTHKAYSWVELKKHDEPVTSAVRHYNTRDGLKEAWNTFSAIRIEGLQPATPLVRSPEYKKAKYRVIISHFPMVMGQEWKDEKAWHGWDDAIRKFLPILNGTKVDLMVSGHTHLTHLHEAGADGNDFPVLEQGYDTAVRIKLDQGKIEYTILGVDGPHGDTIRLK